MKTIKKTVLVVVLVLGTLTSYANNTVLNNVLNPKKVKVVFKNAKKGHELKVKDVNGTILYTENVTKEGEFTKFFDFSKLKNGNYTLELNKDFQIIVKSINIENGNVIFNKDSEKIIYKPVIRNEENRLMISKISFDEKPLQVALYYNNEMIYTETLQGSSVVNRVYKLDEDLTGNYRVVVMNNDRNYSNEFKI